MRYYDELGVVCHCLSGTRHVFMLPMFVVGVCQHLACKVGVEMLAFYRKEYLMAHT